MNEDEDEVVQEVLMFLCHVSDFSLVQCVRATWLKWAAVSFVRLNSVDCVSTINLWLNSRKFFYIPAVFMKLC